MMEGDGGTLPQWKGPKPWWTVLLVTCWLVVGVSTVSGNDTDVNALGGEFEAAFQGKCGPSSPCVQLCVELHDGTFECQCRPGYRLLLDGYSCVELNNSTYSDDDEDSDELESDIDYPVSENQKPIISLKAAKAAAVLPSPSSTPSPYNSDIDSTLEGRPLPRPIASSTYQKRTPKFNSRTDSLAAAKAAAVEDEERNNYLRKFSPIDDPASGPFDYFGLDPDVMAKAAARGLKLTPSTFSATSGKKTAKRKLGKVGEYSGEDEDEEDDDSGDDGDEDDDDEDDSTNEAEEDLGSMEEGVVAALKASQKGMGKGAKTHLGGGERSDEDCDDDEDSSEDDFIPPPRALPLKEVKNVRLGVAPSPSNTPSSFTPSTVMSQRQQGHENVAPPAAPPPPQNVSSSPPPPPEPIKVEMEVTVQAESEAELCPLKCNRGTCVKESLDELGFRCLCPMGTRGTFCEIVEVFEEGGGYNSGLFRGKSWVAFPVLHDAYMADQISLEFRPQSSNGIILLTGERDDLSGDYLALFLNSGYLEFRFDCGSGSGVVRSAAPVKLEQWNKASIVRRRWDGWMQLNDGPFTQARSKGLFSRITFRQPVYIGGQGNITFNSVSTIQSNFDDEPDLVSSSNTQTNVVNDASTTGSTFTSTSTLSSSDSTTVLGVSSSISSSAQESMALVDKDWELDEKYKAKNPKNVAGDANNSAENEESGTVGVLKRVGGFEGCIRNLVINDRVYRFGLEPAGDSLQGFDIENCNDQGVCDLVKCQHGGQCLVQKDLVQCLCPLGFSGPMCETPLDLQIPSFNGSSYLKYGGLGLTRVLSWLELEVVIKPDGMDGLIFYNGYKTDGMGDFISLIIDQSYIEFAMDLGTGAAIIRSDHPIVLGEWHHIHVSRTSRLISLRIDNQPQLMALTPGAFTQLSLPHNLFLGGIPDPEWLSPKVKVQGGFTGCIQKLVINEKPLRIMGSAMSGVNLENCEHPCLRNPCDHGGDCVPQLDTFRCHCPLGFRDPYCQTRMDKEDVITAPKFIGDSYLRFTHPRIIKRLSGWRLNLSFRLKTDSSRGLLLWAGRKFITSASDFISMGLRNGLVIASFSLGSGQTSISYNYTAVNDGRWHHINFVRNEQEASLSVDDGPPVTGIAPGKLRQLNINDGLYIGGLEESRHQSVNRYMEGFMGCLADLVLGSERVALLQEASEGRNVDYCD